MTDPQTSKYINNQEKTISRDLLTWYGQKQRDLPWRRSGDPYHIWVSEIMLQQTQVTAVLPYYARFIDQFPTVCDLAHADLDSILAMWQGLGYYARARNLHRAAQIVCIEYEGRLPDDRETLFSLPGIGDYTVGAILSIAFGQDVAAIDGNVMRVLCRLYDYGLNPKNAQGRKTMQDLAQALVPPGIAGDHNQAMMELGATICQPRSPLCTQCPIIKFCRSYKLGNQQERPIRPPRRQIPQRHRIAYMVEQDGRLLIVRRQENGLLGGLWEIPGAALEVGEQPREAAHRCLWPMLGAQGEIGVELGTVDHAYTHFRVHVTIFAAEIHGKPDPDAEWTGIHWLAPQEQPDYGLTGVTHKILTRLPWAGSGLLP